MSTPAQVLHAIEMRAENAIVQELRIMVKDVLALRPACGPEDRGYADVLLMKLDRLIGDQLAPSVHSAPLTAVAPLPEEAEPLLIADYPAKATLA